VKYLGVKKMSGAKWVVALVIVLIAIGAIFFIFQEVQKREALRNCEINLADVSVKSIGLTSATLNIKLRIYNPNTVTATLDRADYSLYGNENYLGDGTITKRVDIPPGGTTTVTSPFELSYSGAARVIWSALTEGTIKWKIIGTAYIDTPLGTLTIPFEAS